jgi:hypothetical protein
VALALVLGTASCGVEGASADEVRVRLGPGGALTLEDPTGEWRSLDSRPAPFATDTEIAILGDELVARATNAPRRVGGSSATRLVVEATPDVTWERVQSVLRVAARPPARIVLVRLVSPNGRSVVDEEVPDPSSIVCTPPPLLDLRLFRDESKGAGERTTTVRVAGEEFPLRDRVVVLRALTDRLVTERGANPELWPFLVVPPTEGDPVPYADAYDVLEAIHAAGYPTVRLGSAARPSRPIEARRASGSWGDAVASGSLHWLASHQSPDGRWEAGGFGAWCDGEPSPQAGSDGAGAPGHDVAVTGLALLAFLGEGYTNRGDHPFAKTVQRGLRFLKNVQEPAGCFAEPDGSRRVIDHALASGAMVIAYGMTGSVIYKSPAVTAVEHLLAERLEGSVWPATGGGAVPDAAATSWAAAALWNAAIVANWNERRGLARVFPDLEPARAALRAWLDARTDAASGRVGPVEGESGLSWQANTACGLWMRVMSGEDPGADGPIRKGTALLAAAPPTWPGGGTIDVPYAFFGRNGMFNAGGGAWPAWQTSLVGAIDPMRRTDGDACGLRGTWDPVDPRIADWGRVGTTALLSLCELASPYDRTPGFPR